MRQGLRRLLALGGLGLVPGVASASFCEAEGLRVEAVEMAGSSVSAIEVRNVGVAPDDVSGVEIVVVGDVAGAVAAYIQGGGAAIHRLSFPSNVRLDIGQVVTISLRGSYEYRQAHGAWPDFELPVRGGEPEVANMRVAGGLSRLGAAPEKVALVCVASGRDLDVMAVRSDAGRIQAPPWIAPRPEIVPGEGAPSVLLELLVAPSAKVRDDGVATYVVRAVPEGPVPTPVSLSLELPEGLVFESWLSYPESLGEPSAPADDGVFFEGVLQDGRAATWVARVRFDVSAPPEGRLRATARASGGEKDVVARATFTAVPDERNGGPRTPGAPERAIAVSDKGQVGVFSRAFLPDDDPVTQDVNVGVEARLEVDVEHGEFNERARVYALIDATDPLRDAIFVEEALVAWRRDDLRVAVGAVTLNTSRLDTFHPADVINARFLDTEIENPAKIGEPMVEARYTLPTGAISGYFMPWFTAPRLASPRSRFNANPGVVLGPPLFLRWDGVLTTERFGLQWGLNLEQTYGPVDLAVQFLRHQDRQQPIFVEAPGSDVPQLVSLPVNHVGLNYNQAVGSTVLKGEAAWRRFGRPAATPAFLVLPDRDHVALAGGFEYSFGVGPFTVGAFVEGQAIVLEGPDDPVVRNSLTPFQRDVLVGTRLTFNDRANRSLVLLSIVDVETGDEVFGGVRYGQRMGERWTVAASVRAVTTAPVGPAGPVTGLQALRDLDFANLVLSRRF